MRHKATAVAFPTVRWNQESVTFLAAGAAAAATDIPAPAALVFPFYGDKVVLAEIRGRGWCIPSGHVEPGETFEEAVRREAFEEAGATLGRVAFLGDFVFAGTPGGAVLRRAPTFIGEVQGFAAQRPAGSDSRGMQMVPVEDVAAMYYAWDALLAAVFAHAYAEKQRLFPVGLALSALTGGATE